MAYDPATGQMVLFGGAGYSGNVNDTWVYAPPVSVTGVSPDRGPAVGGTSVLITGSDFTGATAVTFGTIPANSFTVVDDNDITAVSPQSEAGTVDVTVTGPDGTSATSPADQYRAIAQRSDPPQPVTAVPSGSKSVTLYWAPPTFDGGPLSRPTTSSAREAKDSCREPSRPLPAAERQHSAQPQLPEFQSDRLSFQLSR